MEISELKSPATGPRSIRTRSATIAINTFYETKNSVLIQANLSRFLADYQTILQDTGRSSGFPSLLEAFPIRLSRNSGTTILKGFLKLQKVGLQRRDRSRFSRNSLLSPHGAGIFLCFLMLYLYSSAYTSFLFSHCQSLACPTHFRASKNKIMPIAVRSR